MGRGVLTRRAARWGGGHETSGEMRRGDGHETSGEMRENRDKSSEWGGGGVSRDEQRDEEGGVARRAARWEVASGRFVSLAGI